MTDSWDEVLDWERWAKEVLTDWRVPFDNHKVGLRLGITQQLCDLRDERDALAARLAEADDNLLSVAIELGTTKARLAEAVECCTIKDNRNLWLEIRLQKVMARCADLLDEDQFNELDAMTRTTETVNGDSASAVQPERCCLDYPRCDCNSPPEPDNAPAVTGLTQQDYDALVRDAMLWRTRSPTGAGGNARAFVCCEGVGQHAPGCIAQEAAP